MHGGKEYILELKTFQYLCLFGKSKAEQAQEVLHLLSHPLQLPASLAHWSFSSAALSLWESRNTGVPQLTWHFYFVFLPKILTKSVIQNGLQKPSYLGSLLAPSWLYTLCNFLILEDSNVSCNSTITKQKSFLDQFSSKSQMPAGFQWKKCQRDHLRNFKAAEYWPHRLVTLHLWAAQAERRIYCVQSIKLSHHTVLEMCRLPEKNSVRCSHEQNHKQANRATRFLIKTWDNSSRV